MHVLHIFSVHAIPTNIKDLPKLPLTSHGGERVIPVYTNYINSIYVGVEKIIVTKTSHEELSIMATASAGI